MRLGAVVLAAAVVVVASYLPLMGWGEAAAGLLTGGVMALIVARSTASGPALVTALVGLHFGISCLIMLPEGVLFDVLPASAAVLGLARALLFSLLTAAVVVLVAGRWRQDRPTRSTAQPIRSLQALLWRLAACVAVFVACYVVAGMIIFPFVREYYEGRAMPPMNSILAMQVLRSLAILGLAYPLLATLPTKRDAVVVLAVALPVLASIAPMLPQNSLMPPSVRLVHALETAPYFALFGALLAVWFGPARAVPGRAAATAAVAAQGG